MIKTSQSHPLRIDAVQPSGVTGLVGMTFCPGKKQRDAMFGGHWDRDLEADLDVITSWGATALLCLIEDCELAELQVEQLEQEAQSRLAYYHLPIVDGDIPDAAGELAWQQIGANLRQRLQAGERIVIHCKGGLGRTGLMAACLLIDLGEDPDNAIRRVRAARPGAIETAKQESYLRGLLRASSVKDRIIALAKQHGVTYVRTSLDELGETIIRLTGDEVVTDDIDELLIAMKRAGVISSDELVALLVGYLEEKGHGDQHKNAG